MPLPPSSLPKPAPFKVPQALAEALALYKQGNLNEAERLYSQVLVHRPDHFDALQMLSVVKLAKGQPAEALRLIRGHAPAQTLAADSAELRNDTARSQSYRRNTGELRCSTKTEIQICRGAQ